MWYAKRPLPGAAPSPEYQFAADEVPGQGTEGTLQYKPEIIQHSQGQASRKPDPVRQHSVDLQTLMAPATANKKTAAPSQSKAASPSVVPINENKPQPADFADEIPVNAGAHTSHTSIAAHLGFWPSERCLLISQWSDEASERLQDSLARNLLIALGETGDGGRKMLHWPVFRNPNIPGNSTGDFQAVLSKLVSAYPDRSIILLGVLGGELDEKRQLCLEAVLPRASVDFPYSLAELSANPVHKRDLWKALKSGIAV